jgi:uncharacterized membrane protein YdfJ with MMPL/SSD domain
LRAVLLPALMTLVGRWNFWAPEPAVRVLAALHLGHEPDGYRSEQPLSPDR